MEEQAEETAGGQALEEEKTPLQEAAPEEEEEEEDALPHSEIMDVFEEGLARLVQDPLLCDLPIQVFIHRLDSALCRNNRLQLTLDKKNTLRKKNDSRK